MADFSPTGYWAHLAVFTWDDDDRCDKFLDEVRPVLEFGDEAMIFNEDGQIVTPRQYVDKVTDGVKKFGTYTRVVGSFEVQPYPHSGE